MGVLRKDRMAREIGIEIRRTTGDFTPSGRHRGPSYSLESLRELGAEFVEAVMRDELGRTSVVQLARYFSVPAAKISALLEQADGPRRLNFLVAGIVRIQMRELVREIRAAGDSGRIVFVRTQPTSPTTGIRLRYGPNTAFGLTPGRKIGAFDAIYATYASPNEGGREQSINLAGLVPALDKDRDEFRAGVSMPHLSPQQFLSLDRPTAAMFRQAGAVDLVARDEVPPEVEASLYVFLQGRYEGYEESAFLSSPTHTVPIVAEQGYQEEARRALGDDVDIVVEAEGESPHDRGLERRHVYVDSQGRAISNEEVRRIIDRDLPYRLDRRGYTLAEHRDVVLMLLPGELRAPLPGDRHEGGQALLQMTADGPLRWFVLLNKANGRRAWRGDRDERGRRLQYLAEALALLEAPDSTAGHARREQYTGLEEFDVPMSHPSGRQNVWALAAARRQGGLPDAPVRVPVI
jgi:hypothetical protein